MFGQHLNFPYGVQHNKLNTKNDIFIHWFHKVSMLISQDIQHQSVVLPAAIAGHYLSLYNLECLIACSGYNKREILKLQEHKSKISFI